LALNLKQKEARKLGEAGRQAGRQAGSAAAVFTDIGLSNSVKSELGCLAVCIFSLFFLLKLSVAWLPAMLLY
jgi:hypothetical protein